MSDYYLLFKWGTLKGWSVPDGKAFELLKDAMDGSPASAMLDKPGIKRRQKICELIDEMDKHNADFTSDWSGEKFNAEQAKDYILSYGE